MVDGFGRIDGFGRRLPLCGIPPNTYTLRGLLAQTKQQNASLRSSFIVCPYHFLP